jgi:purine-binding chemotaxis protein CheW
MLHVLFRIEGTEYVVPAMDVVQMESFAGATRVPGTPAYVAGLVQVRGRVVPVVDLRLRFGLPEIERGLDARVVVVRAGERQVGLLVDRAREVIDVPADAFRPPPDVVGHQAAGFVSEVAQVRDRLLMRIDLGKVIGAAALQREDDHAQANG